MSKSTINGGTEVLSSEKPQMGRDYTPNAMKQLSIGFQSTFSPTRTSEIGKRSTVSDKSK
jgi:hypothetical protein